MFWLKSYLWRLLFPLFSKYYGIRLATTQAEKEKVFKFRYKIYRREMGHHFLDNLLVKDEMLFDEDDLANNTIIWYSGTIDNITGTLRMTYWSQAQFPEKIREKYFLKHLKANTIAQWRFFQVRKDYRRSLLGLTLISYFYKVIHEKNIKVDIGFCDCQPGLLNGYLKIGCYAYTHNVIVKDYGILLIPLAFDPNDVAYFKNSKSIIYQLAKHYADRQSTEINLPKISLQVSLKKLKSYVSIINKEFLTQFYSLISAFIKHVIIIHMPANAIVIKKDIQDYDMFILLEGRMGIYFEGKMVSEVSPGALFGEMALINKTHKRYTDVVCLTDSKIVLIPRNTLANLEKKDKQKAYQLICLIAESLQDKLAYSNYLLAEAIKKLSTK